MPRHPTSISWHKRDLLLIRHMYLPPCASHVGLSYIQVFIRWETDVHGITLDAVRIFKECPKCWKSLDTAWDLQVKSIFVQVQSFLLRKWKVLMRLCSQPYPSSRSWSHKTIYGQRRPLLSGGCPNRTACPLGYGGFFPIPAKETQTSSKYCGYA